MEVMVAAVVFVVAIITILASYVIFMTLNESSRNISAANFYARQKTEEIIDKRSLGLGGIYNYYHVGGLGHTFDITNPHGTGVVDVNWTQSPEPDIIDVRVVICWQERNGRVIGEAIVDAGGNLQLQDLNGNGQIDSPVVVRVSLGSG